MATTYELIKGETLASSAASYTFSAIPATYTDLVLQWSLRDTDPGTDRRASIRFNGDSSSIYSFTLIYSNGSSVGSANQANDTMLRIDGASTAAGATSNTFSSGEVYLPKYNSTTSKPLSVITFPETNAATFGINGPTINACLYRNTSAINTILITASNLFVAGSSFYLYGIKNS